MEANGFQQINSAAYLPATNGLAERFVQTMKPALKTTLNRSLNTFLLTYTNTLHATTKVAPASAMMKRQFRT
jgi:transposase InsO family protein